MLDLSEFSFYVYILSIHTNIIKQMILVYHAENSVRLIFIMYRAHDIIKILARKSHAIIWTGAYTHWNAEKLKRYNKECVKQEWQCLL